MDVDIPDEHEYQQEDQDEQFEEGEDEGDVDGWFDDEEDEELKDPELEKKSSTLDEQITKHNIRLGSKDSIKLFRNLSVTKMAFEISDLIKTHLEELPDVFEVQIFEPLLMFKLSIDLNFMVTEPYFYESLGFNLHELVEFLFIFDDSKLMMFHDDKSIFEKDMAELCGLGILKIEFGQQCNELSENRYQSYLQMLHESFFNKNSDGHSLIDELKKMDEQELVASKSTLLEMGFNQHESEEALKSNKFNIGNAINYLLGRKKKHVAIEESKTSLSELYSFDPKNILFSNVSGAQLRDNPILHYFRYMIYSMDNITTYCCICRDKLPQVSSKIKCCEKELCEFSFEEQLGIYISPEIKHDSGSFVLDLSIFSECVMGGRAAKTFEPFPSFFLKDKEMRSKRGYLDNIREAREKGTEAKDVKEANKDIKKIRTLFKFIPSVDK